MPELPEVETMRRGIAAAVGATICAVTRLPCRLKPLAIQPSLATLRRRSLGQRILATERWGKRVALRLENECRLIFEPRMTGLVLIADPPDTAHLRFRLDLTGSDLPQLWYWDRRGLGSIQCWNAAEFAERLNGDTLGPDALDVTEGELRVRLAASRREIKVALLDQRCVAGIGNLYAAEILHVARIHPSRACESLTNREWQRLHAALTDVLRAAIRYEGSTLGDGTYRNALNQQGTYQNHHRVYAREGRSCPACHKATIVRVVQAQRATFFCPRCQRM